MSDLSPPPLSLFFILSFFSLSLSSLLSERGRGACCALDFLVSEHLRGGPSSGSIKRPGRVEPARITSPKRSCTLSHTRRGFDNVKAHFDQSIFELSRNYITSIYITTPYNYNTSLKKKL